MKQIRKIFLMIIGTIFVLLGIIGIILPVVPTIPFLIIAGICYINSSKTLYKWLIKLKYFGPTIESYIERKEVTKQFKISSLMLLFIPSVITEAFIIKALYLRLIPVVIVILLTLHILSLKTVNKKEILNNTDGLVDKNF